MTGASVEPDAEAATDEPCVTPVQALGRVVRAHGKFFAVQLDDDQRILLATPRGSLKRVRTVGDVVAVGDRVIVTETDDDEAAIDAVLPRTRTLQRPARGTRSQQQIILANVDQALFIFSVAQPEPHLRMLDRFLILAEVAEVPAIVGVNKIDLLTGDPTEQSEAALRIFADFTAAYPVIPFSVRTGEGLSHLRPLLAGKVTAVTGPSGVGKSSLINVLVPGSDRATSPISEATGKGRHTTTTTELYSLGPDTFLADTPGMRALAMRLDEVAPLDARFPEFRPYLGQCRFADCRHETEPGCAIREAVERGAIPRGRYESYLAITRGDHD